MCFLVYSIADETLEPIEKNQEIMINLVEHTQMEGSLMD